MLPESFRFGVATSAYQVEGGLNGPGEPANNWARWEREGRAEATGIAVDFWNHYEDILDRAAAIGCDTFRLGVEWARIEPKEGEIDQTALDRYAAILDACLERGLEPLVTLHHFTHPEWLGEDFWLSPESPRLYEGWVKLVLKKLASRCRIWITLNEINILGPATYMLSLFPPGRMWSTECASRCCANMLAAHVRGYETIHEQQPNAIVFTNNSSSSLYEADRMLIDILLSRSLGVKRAELPAWLTEQRERWYACLPAPGSKERLFRRLSAATAPIARVPLRGRRRRRTHDYGEGEMGAAIDAVYRSEQERTMDILAIDYYDPMMSHQVRWPGRRTAGGRSFSIGVDHWEDFVCPAGLTTYAAANLELSSPPQGKRSGEDKPLELWIVENGLCNRVRGGRSFEREDGWDRPRYLRENLGAVVAGLEAGLPLGAYIHWSLVDSYEWGSYEPRFGIHGVDRMRGAEITDEDAMGRDSAGAYRDLIEKLRSGYPLEYSG